jgi:hypothetical protein
MRIFLLFARVHDYRWHELQKSMLGALMSEGDGENLDQFGLAWFIRPWAMCDHSMHQSAMT